MLIDLSESTDRRVWFYMNWKIMSTVSVEMDETIKHLFDLLFSEIYALARV